MGDAAGRVETADVEDISAVVEGAGVHRGAVVAVVAEVLSRICAGVIWRVSADGFFSRYE